MTKQNVFVLIICNRKKEIQICSNKHEIGLVDLSGGHGLTVLMYEYCTRSGRGAATIPQAIYKTNKIDCLILYATVGMYTIWNLCNTAQLVHFLRTEF